MRDGRKEPSGKRSGGLAATCGTKRAYPSPQAAWAAADCLRLTRQRKKARGSYLARPYKCNVCRLWHLADVEREARFRHGALGR